ncbi:MAG: glycosyltransferase family 4 protein [Minisyncoccia bacterium]
MQIAVIANMRLPTEKAHGYQTMRVCLAWKQLGHDVTLYVPKRPNHISEDVFSYYNLPHEFQIVEIKCFPWMQFVSVLGPFAFWLQSLAFLWALGRRTIPRDAVVFSRNPEVIRYFSKTHRTIWNAHTSASSRAAQFLNGAKGIVCNSEGTARAVASLGLPTVVARNGTDPNTFRGRDRDALRKELGLPEGPLALYTGHLYRWKGVDTILSAALLFPDCTFVLVGGTPKDIATYRSRIQERKLENVLLLGHKKQHTIPQYLVAANALLLPNIAETDESVNHTSPLKLFEYMASGTPIVASDLPAIREVLSQQNAYLVPAGDAAALANAVREIRDDDHAARNRAQQALIEVDEYSWENQAKIAADFMQSLV